MRNVDKMLQIIEKKGPKSVLIHTIPANNAWIVCEKIDADIWDLTLCNPMGEDSHHLGLVSEKTHLKIWKELIKRKIRLNQNQADLAEKMQSVVFKFTKKYSETYKKYIASKQ
jgi:hypothetical protein